MAKNQQKDETYVTHYSMKKDTVAAAVTFSNPLAGELPLTSWNSERPGGSHHDRPRRVCAGPHRRHHTLGRPAAAARRAPPPRLPPPPLPTLRPQGSAPLPGRAPALRPGRPLSRLPRRGPRHLLPTPLPRLPPLLRRRPVRPGLAQ